MNLHQMTFGRLTVIEDREVTSHEKVWCRCSCGTEVLRHVNAMRRLKSTSCGCLRRDGLPKLIVTRDEYDHPDYKGWRAMFSRCYSKNHDSYPRYGGRGISVCERWTVFANFLTDMGERPAGMSIDRIDNDGNYEPGNCRWATSLEQLENRSTTLWFPYRGKWVTLTDLAEVTGVGRDKIYRRYLRGRKQGKNPQSRIRADREMFFLIQNAFQGATPPAVVPTLTRV